MQRLAFFPVVDEWHRVYTWYSTGSIRQGVVQLARSE